MWVVKIGGSLLDRQDDSVERLIQIIIRISKLEAILVIPGGGKYADAVRRLDQEYRIGKSAAHRMAILATHMNAYRVASKLTKISRVISDPKNIPPGKVPILLPYDIVIESSLPESWKVTSDSISAYLAFLLQSKLVMLKDVDGVIVPHPGGKLLPAISTDYLSSLHPSPVDEYLPHFLSTHGMDAWLVNGLHPGRMENLLRKGYTTGTHIYTHQRKDNREATCKRR